MTNDESNSNVQMEARDRFDLEERTSLFGETTVRFCKNIPQCAVTRPLISQLIRAATNVGANYGEANDAESRPDFHHKIGICRKESKETKHFLRMIVAAQPELRQEAIKLWTEAKELNLIFSKIRRSTSKNGKAKSSFDH